MGESLKRARLRETARNLAESARREMGEHSKGRDNEAICALAEAIDALADMCESLEIETFENL